MELPKVLITNLYLRGRSGTETHTFDLARELQRRGLTVGVFSPDRQGVLAQELLSGGIPVVRDPRECPFKPDLIHGHHNLAIDMAIQAFPQSKAIFVCHDAVIWHDRAPRLPHIVSYFAVDELCRQRVASDLNVPLENVEVVGNSVDLTRFLARDHFPDQPRQALVLNHLASETTFVPVVRQASEQLGLELTVMGAHSNNVTDSPQTELPKFDLVFAKGRSAMEALTCGCAVILCGVEGIGPLVTTKNFPELRPWNFGRRLLNQAHDVETIVGLIRQYDIADLRTLTRLARDELSLETSVDRWLVHYRRLLSVAEVRVETSAWVDELRHLYVQLDRLHTLEFENAWFKQNWKR